MKFEEIICNREQMEAHQKAFDELWDADILHCMLFCDPELLDPKIRAERKWQAFINYIQDIVDKTNKSFP